jgi:acyl-CoA thioesterase FadM
MKVDVVDVRDRSFELAIEASDEAGENVFSAKLTPVCVKRPERLSIAIPQVFREQLLCRLPQKKT